MQASRILIYIDQQDKLKTTVFRKPSEIQNFLYVKSENPYSSKKYSLQPSTSNSKKECSTFEDHNNYSRKLI